MRVLLSLIAYIFFFNVIMGQPSTDIFLFDIQFENGDLQILGHENITDRKGYDNQPSFDESSSSVYYTSIRDTQSNVFIYNIATQKTRQLTFTPESEFSPTPIGDGNLSTVRVDLEGVQHLWTIRPYPFRAKKVFDDITGIGYHCWLTDNELALFIVGDPHEMHIANREEGSSEVVAEKIGSALHKVPGAYAVSYMDFSDSTDCRIRTYYPAKDEFQTICSCVPDSEYFIYLDKNWILSGSGSRLMLYDIIKKEWSLAADLSVYAGLDFYRLSISADKRKLALVSRMPD